MNTHIEIGSLYWIKEGFKNRQGNPALCKVLKANADNTFEVEAYGIVGPGDEVIVKGVPGNVLVEYESGFVSGPN